MDSYIEGQIENNVLLSAVQRQISAGFTVLCPTDSARFPATSVSTC